MRPTGWELSITATISAGWRRPGWITWAQLGWGLERLEAMGSVSPATYLDAKYKQTTTFPDVMSIQVTLTQFTGDPTRLHYVMTKEGGPVVFEGNSEHCFQDQQGHILRLRKAFPAFARPWTSSWRPAGGVRHAVIG